jgi:hypothetical protein
MFRDLVFNGPVRVCTYPLRYTVEKSSRLKVCNKAPPPGRVTVAWKPTTMDCGAVSSQTYLSSTLMPAPLVAHSV